MNNMIKVGERQGRPAWGPKMKIIATGEICELKSHRYPDFEVQLPSGALKHFHRRELENLRDLKG